MADESPKKIANKGEHIYFICWKHCVDDRKKCLDFLIKVKANSIPVPRFFTMHVFRGFESGFILPHELLTMYTIASVSNSNLMTRVDPGISEREGRKREPEKVISFQKTGFFLQCLQMFPEITKGAEGISGGGS